MLVLSTEGLWLTDTFRHRAEDVNRYIPLGKQHGKDLKAVFLDWELILRKPSSGITTIYDESYL